MKDTNTSTAVDPFEQLEWKKHEKVLATKDYQLALGDGTQVMNESLRTHPDTVIVWTYSLTHHITIN